MKQTIIRSLLFLLFGCAGMAAAAPQTITGPATHVSLFELYTSEGCNTCPPAEEWISRFQQDTRLWKEVVPVAFHVDYWDNLGWKDPFDSAAYTERQQAIASLASGLAGRVIYTPQFVLDGKDWRGFFSDEPLQVNDTFKLGALSLMADGRKVTLRFAPTLARNERLEAHVVLLAFGVEVKVGAGENQGATLRHDFLVVASGQGTLMPAGGELQASVRLSPAVQVKASRYALAGWVSAADSPLPIQAVGGWLSVPPN